MSNLWKDDSSISGVEHVDAIGEESRSANEVVSFRGQSLFDKVEIRDNHIWTR